MNNTNKDQQECDVICRNHLTKTERELYRVCPSKLSKRELENLYFALLENNLDLKKTLHSQQDKVKVLSTKLQRMTVVQRNAAGKEKNCCPSKALLNEQKEVIAELKKANERMADRIRILNMRLCSAKQFLKRSPSQIARCSRCNNAPGITAFKNSSMSALNAKPSVTSVKMNVVSCQYLSEDPPESAKTTRTVDTETDPPEKKDTEKPCNENKCRTVMDELKQKIVNLQEELSKTHDEYSSRISKLENDVSVLHNENVRVRSNNVASENAIQLGERKAEDLRGKLRVAEGKINELAMQLTIEKRKVAELETTLKLTNTSSQMVQMIEKLNTLNQQKPQTVTVVRHSASPCTNRCVKQDTDVGTSPRIELPSPSPKSKEEAGCSKSDDSGCTDLNKSSEAEEEKVMDKINQELLKKISDLQTQLDTLGIKAAGESIKVETQSSIDLENFKDERQLYVITITEDKQNEIQGLNALDEKETNSQAEKDIDTSAPIEGQSGNQDEKAGSSTRSCEDCVVEKKTDKEVNESISATRLKSQMLLDTCKKQAEHNRYQIPGPIPALIAKDSKSMKKRMTDENRLKIIEKKGYCDDDTCPNRKGNTLVKETANNNIASDIDGLTAKINDTPKQALKTADRKDEPLNDLAESSHLITVTSDISNSEKNQSGKISSDFIDLGHRKVIEDSFGTVELKKEVEIVKSSATRQGSDSSYFHRSNITIGPPVDSQNNIGKSVSAQTANVDRKFLDGNTDEFVTRAEEEHSTPTAPQPRRDSASQSAVASTSVRDSAKYNAAGPLAKDSAVNTTAAACRRESVKYGTQGGIGFKDSAANSAATAVLHRDSKTGRDKHSTVSASPRRDSVKRSVYASAFKDSSTQSTAAPARRDSATYNAEAPSSRRDSASYNAEAPPARRDSATYNAEAPSDRRDSATYTAEAPPLRRDSATVTKPGYQLLHCRCSRATSPANTEHEISSLSDLPPENGVSPRSPGEARSPRTDSTHPHTHTHTDYGTLSEGELPSPVRNARCRTLSFGEKTTYVDPVRESSNCEMEATLNAISAELARCRRLLASTRPQERERTRRRSAARRPAGSAAFTLHIGTLVLTDEAVLNTRDKSLVLTWKFYDQSVAMTRMRAGRVVLFDFSTEYDVTFSEEFLNYLKQEEMPLTICEMNKLNEPFATCSLPLRDALLHTNRRADMSLALVAGPGMRGGADELGVLDLWCSLRADQGLLHGTATHPSLDVNKEDDYTRGTSRFIDDTAEDERSSTRISQEFAFASHARNQRQSSQIPEIFKEYRRRSSQTPKSFLEHRASHSRKSQVGFEMWPSSNSANIRSKDEMKQALERNVQPTQEMDDEISQAQSSIASLKNMSAKHRLQKMKSAKVPAPSGMNVPEGLQDLLKKERKLSTAAIAKQHLYRKLRLPFSNNSREEEEIDSSITRTYNNTGSNKGLDMSRKTVKYTDDAPNYEDSKQESSEDNAQNISITVLWLALNEECEAMVNPQVHRLYVAYTFLGRRGAELETPVSVPKPKHYADKCYFNFKKTFHVQDAELPLLAHMARCRAGRAAAAPRDCVVFSVVSEPPEDPLGLSSCVDIGHAYLYLGDILAYSADSAGYTEVVPVRGAGGAVCGVLALRVDGLHLLRRCLALSLSARDLTQMTSD